MSDRIPTPSELRVQIDAHRSAELAASLRSLVDDLRRSPTLRASRVVNSRALGDAIADKLRAAGWVVTVSAEHQRDGNGYVVYVSASDAGAVS